MLTNRTQAHCYLLRSFSPVDLDDACYNTVAPMVWNDFGAASLIGDKVQIGPNDWLMPVIGYRPIAPGEGYSYEPGPCGSGNPVAGDVPITVPVFWGTEDFSVRAEMENSIAAYLNNGWNTISIGPLQDPSNGQWVGAVPTYPETGYFEGEVYVYPAVTEVYVGYEYFWGPPVVSFGIVF